MSDPSKTNGNVNSVVGTARDSLGNALGNESMQAHGKKQHAEGETEVKAAETKGWVEGAADTVQGYVKNVTGALTGDSTQQAEGKVQEKKGDAQRAANA